MTLYPLRFEPLFKRYLWGGRRLATELGKPIGEGDDYAESWELVDHGEDQSRVAHGPLAGATLRDLIVDHPVALLGADRRAQQFPLLFKFLDARRDLSVQVHPNDAQGAQLDPPDLGKTEAWVILDAAPGSKVYAGLQSGVTRQQLEQAIERGDTASCMHAFEPVAGDCIFVPAGTLHALGAGLLVAEIQQASDTTFRVFDWNRVGADGNPRELHVEQALRVIDFDRGPVSPQPPEPLVEAGRSRLVRCDKFILDRRVLSVPTELELSTSCHILVVLAGGITVSGDPTGDLLTRGQTILLPSCLGRVELTPERGTLILDVHLP